MVSLDLNILIAKFPLLLGLVLASLSLWISFRLRELAWMVHLMTTRGQGMISWEWFFGRMGLAFSQRQESESEQTRPKYIQRKSWLWMVGSITRCLLAWGWIGLAAWELNGWGEMNYSRSELLALGGGLAFAVAQGYRWYVIRQVLVLSRMSSGYLFSRTLCSFRLFP